MRAVSRGALASVCWHCSMQSGCTAVHEGKQCLFPCDVTMKSTSSFIQINSCNLPYAFCEQIGKEIRDISDKIPFEIPDSWEWCRLSNLAIKEIKRGKSPVYADSGSVLVFAQKCNVKTGRINITLAKYLADSVISKYPQEEYMQDRDIIVNSTGTGTLGRIGLYSDRDNPNNLPLVPDSHVTIVRVCKSISQYIYYILKWYQPYLEESGEGSTKQKELKADRIKELFIPIPPLAEQHRIVAKIEELLPYIERYGKAEEHLTTLNTTFPEALKKSILQEAVQGKLVPQNSDDEPASVLLERIRAEKQKLIKAGKIKKNKHESVIVTRDKIPYEIVDGKERCIADDVPFEIPDTWCWCRLGTISCYFDAGKSPNCIKQSVTGDEYGVITTTSIQLGYFNESQNKVLPPNFEVKEDMKVKKGDILITRAGPMNRTGVACVVKEIHYNLILSDKTIRINMPDEFFDKDYIVTVLNSPNIREQIIRLMSGMDKQQVNISQDKYKTVFIPLPPLEEQHRIVAKIEELMQYCDRLK